MERFKALRPEEMLAEANRAAWDLADAVRASAYSPRYHITAPSGWINDPNGLCRFNGLYHVFYQHFPYGPDWGPMHWGHVTSEDLVHWKHEPVALAPDQPYEKGCFSGSAVVDDGVLTLIYTAHDDESPIMETQCVARSTNGIHFVKSPLNPVIPRFPAEGAKDFRDPKVWRQDGKWHLVLGSSHAGRGTTLLYTGDDLEHWEYRGVFCESDGAQGWMWECPNYCRVDGQDILITSPMDFPGHRSLVVFGKFDPVSGHMSQEHWQDPDYGESFYAAQVMDLGDRVILLGWMTPWDQKKDTRADHWQGALTLPRELHVKDGRLLQTPVRELEALRGEKLLETDSAADVSALSGDVLELNVALDDAPAAFTLSDADGELFSVRIEAGQVSFKSLSGEQKVAPLTLTGQPRELHVFVDRCAMECYINGGEVCITRYIYPRDNRISYRLDGRIRSAAAWALGNAFLN